MKIENYPRALAEVLDDMERLLTEKNRKYGDSIFTEGILFQIDPEIGIKARINDKLARIRNQNSDEDEDPYWDLLGYLIQLEVYKREVKKKEELKQFKLPF